MINKKKGTRSGRQTFRSLDKSSFGSERACMQHFSCLWRLYDQTMSYEEQMKMKGDQVKEILDAAILEDSEFEGVKASPKEFAYRNKMEFSFGDEYKDGPLSLGLHKREAHMMC